MINSITFEQVYAAEVVIVGMLLIYVMQKAGLDPLYSREEQWVKSGTRISLITGALLASVSFFFTAYPGMGVLLAAAIIVLGWNAFKLHRRVAPPADKARIEIRWRNRAF